MKLVNSIMLGAALTVGAAAYADGYYGGGPQGFNTPDVGSVAGVKRNAYDDQWVTLRGRLVNYLGEDRYEFSDDTGSIEVELDDDQNWSFVSKGELIELTGEVDKDFFFTTIDVKRIVSLEKPAANQNAGFGGYGQPGQAQQGYGQPAAQPVQPQALPAGQMLAPGQATVQQVQPQAASPAVRQN